MIQQIVINITQKDVDMLQELVDKGEEVEGLFESENSDDLVEICFMVSDEEQDEQ